MSPSEHDTTAVAVHVERTSDPRVMRWVTHDPRLAATPDGRRCPSLISALGRLHVGGVINSVTIVGSDLLVGIDDAQRWTEVVGAVHAAVVDDLATGGAWWDEPVGGIDEPTRVDVQRVIDDTAGDVMALHGGWIEVVAVVDRVVEVRMHGACHGCAGSADTLQRIAWSAIARAFPELVEIRSVD